MIILSLISPAAQKALTKDIVENLRNALGGGDVTWLNPNIAAEFPLPATPAHFDQIWSDLQNLGIDATLTPATNRRKQLLLADMDSTMIEQECIDELAAEAGIGDQVATITTRAMNGELDFNTALRERVSLLKGLPANVIEHVLKTRITYMPGGRELVQTMKANGATAALVSGGFTAFTAQVAADLGFDHNRANTLCIENNHLTGKVTDPILGREAKVDALNELTQNQNLTPDDVIAVGDGANDLGMLQLAGMGVALHAKPAVQEQAKIRINHGDLTALLYLQGYHQNEFKS